MNKLIGVLICVILVGFLTVGCSKSEIVKDWEVKPIGMAIIEKQGISEYVNSDRIWYSETYTYSDRVEVTDVLDRVNGYLKIKVLNSWSGGEIWWVEKENVILYSDYTNPFDEWRWEKINEIQKRVREKIKKEETKK